MVRRALLLALAALVVAVPAAQAKVSWKIKGAGFGHGVGMSQYGAYGYAKHGVGYAAWTWDTWGNCHALISSYGGRPAHTYGAFVKRYLARRVAGSSPGLPLPITHVPTRALWPGGT